MKRTLISLLLVIFSFSMYLGPCLAEIKPSNHAIFEAADDYSNGSGYYTCKEFVQQVMSDVDITLGSGYRQCYLNVGYEITEEEALEGDVIQISNDPEGSIVPIGLWNPNASR
jgi:hypothetical protein